MSGIAFGRYQLLEPIGAGGMAEVWRAQLLGAHNFARTVVIKRILPHLNRNAEFGEMFKSEALLLARLDHPNIVQVIELSSVESELFIAMEFLDGVDVLELIRRLLRRGPIPISVALYVMREVARALGYAHNLTDADNHPLELIHRDVSPSNVMVLFDGRVKLLDFGIAKAIDRTDRETRTGVLKGKLGYMSPEAVSGHGDVKLDHRTDLFSAGAILHELLCGKRLFKGTSEILTLDLIRRCVVPAPSTLRSEVPPEIDAIVARALARDRDDRYQSAGELADDLSTALRQLGGWDADAMARFLREQGVVAGEREPTLAPTKSDWDGAQPASPPMGMRWAWLSLATLLAFGAGVAWRHRTRSIAPVTSAVPAVVDTPIASVLPAPPPITTLPPPTPTASPPRPPTHSRHRGPRKIDVLGGDVFDANGR